MARSDCFFTVKSRKASASACLITLSVPLLFLLQQQLTSLRVLQSHGFFPVYRPPYTFPLCLIVFISILVSLSPTHLSSFI